MERLSVLYASSLYDLAVQKNAVEDFFVQAKMCRLALQTQDCERMLLHPQITASQKHEFFKNAFAGKVHDDILGFLYLTADKNREAYLIPALDKLIEIIERHMNIVTAKVLSASELDDAQTKRLTSMLSKKLKKNVKLSLNVDPSVIGGPYIYADGYYIDWTVKKKLRDLAVYMKEGCGA
ncbi:MAG: ATP synthase F1 subunit delta [Oscillospiraceae bacterium]|nr:ATP synthase F1 subunit delta [Oscillospiraceae bacterium]